jgi:hypothetical protein
MSKPRQSEGPPKAPGRYASATWSHPQRLNTQRLAARETACQWWRWLTRRVIHRD